MSTDPLRVAGPAPAVDVAALARLFTGPALTGEFLPGAFWSGVRLDWPLPGSTHSGRSLTEEFAAAVEDLCSGAEAIGVTLSGGLDSLAVLCRLVELRPARRLSAYCVALTDDRGVGSADVARQLVSRVRAATGADVTLTVIDPADCPGWPIWSPHGPRLDALPGVNAAIAEQAAADGVRVLLHGDGADELLGVPSYALVPILAAHGVRAGTRHLADVRRSGSGWAGELLAAAADRFPPHTRARWYWAANWPDWCEATVSPVVDASLRDRALRFAAEWIAARIDDHVRHGRRWAEADAVDAFWPRTHVPRAGPVPEASPFLTERVVSAAWPMPPAARYDPRQPTAYQRYKAAVVALTPEWIRSALPSHKQYFTRALADAAAGELPVPFATAAGLLDPDALAVCTDVATRMTAIAVERWLAGAHAAGHSIPGVGR